MISHFRQASRHLQRKQHESFGQHLEIAKTMIRAKIKNQTNLLKYFARYRKTSQPQAYLRLTRLIDRLPKVALELADLQDKDRIRGIEGSCSGLYWQGFALLIGDDLWQRDTKDARDAVHQALNYGYGILYHRVQSALVCSRLDIYTPLFHSVQENKPTLAYDMIEEFRQCVVDREVIAIVNHHQKLSCRKAERRQRQGDRGTSTVAAR